MVINKLVVKVIKIKKGLDPLYCVRGFLIINYFNLFRVNFNSINTYNKPKVFYIFYLKFIFFNISLQALFLKSFQDLLDMDFVFK